MDVTQSFRGLPEGPLKRGKGIIRDEISDLRCRLKGENKEESVVKTLCDAVHFIMRPCVLP